jgi:hypothetical protein
MQQFDIDIVYLWVDGSDPEWLARKNSFLGNKANANSEAISIARSADNDELKYALRSLEKYASWIRRIFIVTDGQTPRWLNTQNAKIQIIDISELLPKEALPCYNSVIIEHFLWKIPGLAEHFLYANDDMFFNSKINPDFFFTSDGFPVVRLKRTWGSKWFYFLREKFNIHTNIYRKTIHRSALLIEEKFGKYVGGMPHHNIDAYCKSDYQAVAEKNFKSEIQATINHHIRSEKDIQRIIYLYYALATQKGKLRYVNRYESCRIRLHKPDFMHFISKYKPSLFCLNDSHHASDNDRKRVKPFLNALYPDKSSFEI